MKYSELLAKKNNFDTKKLGSWDAAPHMEYERKVWIILSGHKMKGLPEGVFYVTLYSSRVGAVETILWIGGNTVSSRTGDYIALRNEDIFDTLEELLESEQYKVELEKQNIEKLFESKIRELIDAKSLVKRLNKEVKQLRTKRDEANIGINFKEVNEDEVDSMH